VALRCVMPLPAALTRPRGSAVSLAALTLVAFLGALAGRDLERSRNSRLPRFDQSMLAASWCDHDTWHIAGRIGPDSGAVAGELSHEESHVFDFVRTGCGAALHFPDPPEVLHAEARALCAEAHHAATAHLHHDIQEYDDVARRLVDDYGLLSAFPIETINAAADHACAPYRAKTAKH
jgi:hypothetical protein